MKKMILFASLLLAMMITNNNVFAQASATASANATIITPIAIAVVNNMNFGNVAVAAGSGGTVVLLPAGTRTSTGGVTLPATTGTVTAASFTVTGASGFTYAITLPSSCVINDGGSNNMTVNTFTSNPSGTATLVSGTSTLTVGATLNVTAAQAAGIYTNASGVPITVNYN
jgi:hypothetical protein